MTSLESDPCDLRDGVWLEHETTQHAGASFRGLSEEDPATLGRIGKIVGREFGIFELEPGLSAALERVTKARRRGLVQSSRVAEHDNAACVFHVRNDLRAGRDIGEVGEFVSV